MKPGRLLAVISLVWWIGVPESSACGTCTTAAIDLLIPPALLWAGVSLTWFLSLAIVSSVSGFHFRGQPSLLWSLPIVVAALFVGAAALGPLAAFALAIAPIFATVRAARSNADMPPSVRNAVRVIGVVHVAVVLVGIGLLVSTLRTRTEGEYICKWSGTAPARGRFKALKKQEPGAIGTYRYIVEHGTGTIVGEAAERIGEIGDPIRDTQLLEHAKLRATDASVSRAVDSALAALLERRRPGA